MLLAGYTLECYVDVKRFYEWWTMMHEVYPEGKPLEMEPGDWHEQFLMFLSSEE